MTEIMCIEWFSLPKCHATDEQRLNAFLRFARKDILREAILFSHGTIAIVLTTASTGIDAIKTMKAYDVPFDGAGGPPGDIDYMRIDDGSINYTWRSPSDWGGPEGCTACSILTEDEITEFAGVSINNLQDVHLNPDGKGGFKIPEFDKMKDDLLFYRAGLIARRNRSLDARELVVVRKFKMSVTNEGSSHENVP